MLAPPLMAITASIAANGVALPPEGGLAARSDWAVFDVVGLFRNAPLKVFRSARRRIPRGDARSHGPGQIRLEWCLMPRNFEQRQHMSGKIPVGPYRQRNAIDQGMERPHEQDLTDCDQDAGRKKGGKEKEPAKQTWPEDDELEALLGSLRRSTEVHGSTHDELAREQKHRCADVEGVERRADKRQDPQWHPFSKGQCSLIYPDPCRL